MCDQQMAESVVRNRLTRPAWVAVILVAGFLGWDTIMTMQRVGLVGERPPVPVFQAAVRILIAIVAVALWFVFRGILERIALLTAAAAASSTALYGFGFRSPGLSAFRLLSHLAAYALVIFAMAKRISGPKPPLQISL
jgi:hypothetical protein